MSTKFFTNKDDNTLLNKFKGIFEHTEVNGFDALVGYFRSSGYFRIREHLKDVEKIRILVGIDVDHLISEAARKGLEFNFNTNVTREEFIRDLRNDIEQCDYSKNVEDGIIQFVDDITKGRIEIKAHPDKNIHAKIYIFRPKQWNEHNAGRVITGSSNLSISGIEKNFEFNVLLPYYDDVVFATTTFEDLWKEAIDILPDTVQEVKNTTHLSEEFTPFEIYIKLLIEYFGKSIEYDPESITDLPKGYKKLAYQIDAVNDGYSKLLKHSGFILADVVGLGKTIIATIIAKKFYFANGYRTKTLIIYPPAIEKNWRRTIRDFEVPNIDFITNGSLHKIKHPEDYDLIIVDEAHKFRSDESEMFHQLQKLCKTKRKRKGNDLSDKKKVILVTATPLNNRPEDIRNQLYLFQDSKQSTLEVGNLQHFFRPLIDKYAKLKKERDHIKIAQGVKEIYEEIRNKILEPIIVRRTRTDIKNTPSYLEDIKEQGVSFPEIVPPKQVLYQLTEEMNELYDETIKTVKDSKNGLSYYRYQAIKFMSDDAKKQYKKATGVDPSQADRISEQLAVIMKVLLVKRIDSSFHAFKMSLKRFYDANRAMLKMIDNGKIYIAPKLGVSEYILNDNETELDDLLLNSDDPSKIQAFDIEEFSEEYIQGIRNDDLLLKELVKRWNAINSYDPKYETFIDKLKTEFFNDEINKTKKLVVFSESKETTEYLVGRLKNDGFTRILSVDSSNSKNLTDVIAENFDANQPIAETKNDYDIVITTEVLAEGVNLHRSNVIVNYDIPWNATKLMQRIGRVNRIGTPAKFIYIYNFFPTEQADNEIELNKKAYMKLQAFHSALGEDSQIYSTKEEYDSYGLFEQLPEEEKDERLEYLNYLRKFREEHPDKYQYVKNKIPRRARCGRNNKAVKGQTIAYIKNKKRDAYYLMHTDNSIEELTFVEAARLYKAEFTERATKLPKFHYDQINTALNSFLEDQSLLSLGTKASVKLGPNERRAIALLKNAILQEFASESEKELLLEAKKSIEIGRFQKLPREINKLKKESISRKLKRVEEFNEMMKIIKSYPLEEIKEELFDVEPKKRLKTPINSKPQIIISESFTS